MRKLFLLAALQSSEESASPPVPQVIFHDTFTGTNGTLLTAHSPEIGGAWSFAGSGTLRITNNAATSPAGAVTYPHHTAITNVGRTDYEIDVTWALNCLSAIVLRYLNAQNHYLVVFWPAHDVGVGNELGDVSLYKVDANVLIPLEMHNFATPLTPPVVKVVVQGTQVTITYNGVTYAFVPQMDEFLSSTVVGIHSNPLDGLTANFIIPEFMVTEIL